jgi:uncharacterized protein YceK
MRTVALATFCLLTSGCSIWSNQPEPSTSTRGSVATVTVRLQEDDPGWDCATMGNKVCGPQAR